MVFDTIVQVAKIGKIDSSLNTIELIKNCLKLYKCLNRMMIIALPLWFKKLNGRESIK